MQRNGVCQRSINQARKVTNIKAPLTGIQDQTPSSDLIELVNILKEKYICISELRHLSWEESEEHEQIWADGPLLNNIEGDVFTFSLVSDALGDPLEYILKTANGIAIYQFVSFFRKRKCPCRIYKCISESSG